MLIVLVFILFHFHMAIRPFWPQSWWLNLTWLDLRFELRISNLRCITTVVVTYLFTVNRNKTPNSIVGLSGETAEVYNKFVFFVSLHVLNRLRHFEWNLFELLMFKSISIEPEICRFRLNAECGLRKIRNVYFAGVMLTSSAPESYIKGTAADGVVL